MEENETLDDKIKEHYSVSKGPADRRMSSTIVLRELNNFVKFAQLRKVLAPGQSAVDLGCGKGGDIIKFGRLGATHVAFVDITESSLVELLARLREGCLRFSFAARVLLASIVDPELPQKLAAAPEFPPDPAEVPSTPFVPGPSLPPKTDLFFDVASCQFCFNYVVSSAERAHRFFANAAELLKPGGRLVVSFPDSAVLATKLAESENNKFGNKLYSVDFDSTSSFNETAFGVHYTFSLTDAVDALDEYVVPEAAIAEIADNCGFLLKLEENFVPFFVKNMAIVFSAEERQRNYSYGINTAGNFLIQKLDRLLNQNKKNINYNSAGLNNDIVDNTLQEYTDENTTLEVLDEDIWEIFYLYKVVVFEKLEID